MTGSDASHASHPVHPVTASIVALVIVAMFTAVFAAMTTKALDGPVILVAVIMAGWGLTSIWALDSDPV